MATNSLEGEILFGGKGRIGKYFQEHKIQTRVARQLVRVSYQAGVAHYGLFALGGFAIREIGNVGVGLLTDVDTRARPFNRVNLLDGSNSTLGTGFNHLARLGDYLAGVGLRRRIEVGKIMEEAGFPVLGS